MHKTIPIDANNLKILAEARLGDAIALYKQKRYNGTSYLCGYAVELALKYKICQQLGWQKYLPTRFDNDRTFYTHNLDNLKFLSGMQQNILNEEHNPELWACWSDITGENGWNEQLRYDITSKSRNDVKPLLRASILLYKELIE